jgi:ABC-2 type transport system permease protein
MEGQGTRLRRLLPGGKAPRPATRADMAVAPPTDVPAGVAGEAAAPQATAVPRHERQLPREPRLVGLTQVLAVTLKELRELLRRPLLVLTLVLGPLAIMLIFGVGTDNVVAPPRAIVVVPPGKELPRLVQEHQREFDKFLSVQEYTTDEQYARNQLAKNLIDAVVILPPTPYETIASGEQAHIKVIYNEIDPARRQLVPDFVRVMVGDINHEIFLQNAQDQQTNFNNASRDISIALKALNLANEAVNHGDRAEAKRQVDAAQVAVAQLDDTLVELSPDGGPFQDQVAALRLRLQQASTRLAQADQVLATPDPRPLGEQLGLAQQQQQLQALNTALNRLTSVPPEVAIAPLAADTNDATKLNSDVISFFAPAMLALILQHAAVSLGALAFVRERLSGAFEMYTIAPTSGLKVLVGKYLAYLFFVLVIGGALLAVLLSPLLRVPLFGSFWRLALVVVLMTLASIGLGLALSLLAISERQAVQFAMLSLLAIVFFSGIALPLDSLKFPALLFSYVLPATYGAGLLQDIMLRGLPGNSHYLLALAAMTIVFFAACVGLLRWRTRPA